MEHTLVTAVVLLVLAFSLYMARRNEQPRHEFYVDYAEITRRCSGSIIAVTVGYSVLVVVVVALVTR